VVVLSNPARPWSLAAWICIAALMGCVQPQGNDNGLINHDPDRPISSEHWEVYEVPKDQAAMASVVSATRNGSLHVLCEKNDESVILIGSKDGAELKDTSITVTFDGNITTNYPWVTTTGEDGWGVGLVENQKDFWPALAALRQHRAVEVVVSESGKEWRRLQFTLARADEAIDLVFKECGKPADG
jgi:hypothetical protein